MGKMEYIKIMLITINYSLDGQIGLFFVAKDKLLLHTCLLDEGEPYGDFINYPDSHDAVWQREYHRKYCVDFDYFPRGRMIYNRMTGVYLLYHDPCAAAEAEALRGRYPDGKCVVAFDEHYQCHRCNSGYIR